LKKTTSPTIITSSAVTSSPPLEELREVSVGIIGGAGYTAGELLRLLLQHSKVKIQFVQSKSHAGQAISVVHKDLFFASTLIFTDQIDHTIDVLFLCVGHGEASVFWEKNTFSKKTKIIDLSQDFRLKKENNAFVYGLPELQKTQIQQAQYIANPGCFATAIQLALLPLAATGLLQSDIHVQAITGSTGAGQSLQESSHFSWREGNMSVYKPFEHQHLQEIKQSLTSLQTDFQYDIHFIPVRGNFTRGIFATIYLDCDLDENEAKKSYRDYYRDAPFVTISDKNIDLKQVVNTNHNLLFLQKNKNKLLIISAIDNLLKGASGQAVQNMNLLFGFDEMEGLRLKGAGF
jgi:N-acetyl-gamma-glutamyl-phosphate reductase